MPSRPSPRARLHQALLDLCFERGFKRLELGELLARAGVDRATFAREFADLEDCFFAVFKAEVDRCRRQAAAIADHQPRAWRERVRAGAYALYRYLAADERRGRFILVESRGAGERTLLLAGQRIEALFDLIDAGRRELGDPDSITRATAESLGGGILNQLYAILGRGPLPPEGEIVPQLMYTVVLPYLGPTIALQELAIPPPPHPAEPRPLGASRG